MVLLSILVLFIPSSLIQVYLGQFICMPFCHLLFRILVLDRLIPLPFLPLFVLLDSSLPSFIPHCHPCLPTPCGSPLPPRFTLPTPTHTTCPHLFTFYPTTTLTFTILLPTFLPCGRFLADLYLCGFPACSLPSCLAFPYFPPPPPTFPVPSCLCPFTFSPHTTLPTYPTGSPACHTPTPTHLVWFPFCAPTTFTHHHHPPPPHTHTGLTCHACHHLPATLPSCLTTCHTPRTCHSIPATATHFYHLVSLPRWDISFTYHHHRSCLPSYHTFTACHYLLPLILFTRVVGLCCLHGTGSGARFTTPLFCSSSTFAFPLDLRLPVPAATKHTRT